jgi:DUF917 family protein
VAPDRTRHTRHENLVAYIDDAPIATVPDLICVVGAADAEPITTELPRYGQRIAVVGIPCRPLLRTPEALAMVGPRVRLRAGVRPLEPGGPLPWTSLA